MDAWDPYAGFGAQDEGLRRADARGTHGGARGGGGGGFVPIARAPVRLGGMEDDADANPSRRRRRTAAALHEDRMPTVDELDALAAEGYNSASQRGGGGGGSSATSSTGDEGAAPVRRQRPRHQAQVPRPRPPAQRAHADADGPGVRDPSPPFDDRAAGDRSPSLIQPAGEQGGQPPAAQGNGNGEGESDVVMDMVRAPLRGFEWYHALPEARSRYCYVCWSRPSAQNRYLEIVNEIFSWRMRMSDEIIVTLVHRIYHENIRHSSTPAKPEWDARVIYAHMTKHVKTEESLLATTINQTVAVVDSLVETYERLDPANGANGALMAPDPRAVKTLLAALSMQARLSSQLGNQRLRAAALANAGGGGGGGGGGGAAGGATT